MSLPGLTVHAQADAEANDPGITFLRALEGRWTLSVTSTRWEDGEQIDTHAETIGNVVHQVTASGHALAGTMHFNGPDQRPTDMAYTMGWDADAQQITMTLSLVAEQSMLVSLVWLELDESGQRAEVVRAFELNGDQLEPDDEGRTSTWLIDGDEIHIVSTYKSDVEHTETRTILRPAESAP